MQQYLMGGSARSDEYLGHGASSGFCCAAEDCLLRVVKPIFKGFSRKLGYTACTGRLSANTTMNPFSLYPPLRCSG